MYEPGVVGAVPAQVYAPPVVVVAMTMFVFELNTHTIGSGVTPTPPSVNVPVTVNGEPGVRVDGVAEAVSIVETGFDKDPDLRVNRTVPGPLNVAIVGLLDPEHVNPSEQVQPENV